MPTKIRFDKPDALRLGKNITIGAFSEIIVLESTSFSPIKGALEIGDRVVIGKGANIRAAGGPIVIGEGALLAQDVSLIAANHLLSTSGLYRDQPWDSSRVGVIVGRNVWIGAGVIVLPGVDIGDNSVIGAGSVVTKNIPSNQIWAGVPARCIKSSPLRVRSQDD
jgi:acetyltransferase-like isoleucine patch superfamily enzyme